MDINKVRDEVTKLVEDILAKKADAGLQADVEEALKIAEKSVRDLTDRVAEVEAKAIDDAAAMEALEGSKSGLETELAAKQEELVSLQTEKEVLFKRVEVAEATLDTMEKDKLTKDRMSELDGLKISRADDARDMQAEIVREMSDEDFADYKKDMVSLRNEFVQSVKEELAATKGGKYKPEERTSVDGESNVAEGEGDVQTPPADIAGALETASTALPNVENTEGSKKWKNFGTGLSKILREQRGEASKETQ